MPFELFAPVMALGILSIDAAGDWSILSVALLALAIIALGVITVRNLSAASRMRQPSRLSIGAESDVAFVMFTWTAGCGVIADRVSTVVAAKLLLTVLSVAGFGCGLVAVGIAIRRRRAFRVGGRWLLLTVAFESVAINLVSLAGPSDAEPAGFAWVVGLMTYVFIVGAILRAIATGTVRLDRLTPDYWITMGALAISTVAAHRLTTVLRPADANLVQLAMFALWIGASLWIPLLVAAELLRARSHEFQLRYDPMRWATVFPLGMFALATRDVAVESRISDLAAVSTFAFYVALTVALVLGALIAVRGFRLTFTF
jgi:hypothetical protein